MNIPVTWELRRWVFFLGGKPKIENPESIIMFHGKQQCWSFLGIPFPIFRLNLTVKMIEKVKWCLSLNRCLSVNYASDWPRSATHSLELPRFCWWKTHLSLFNPLCLYWPIPIFLLGVPMWTMNNTPMPSNSTGYWVRISEWVRKPSIYITITPFTCKLVNYNFKRKINHLPRDLILSRRKFL